MMADCVIRHNYRPKNGIPLISSIARGNSKREGNQHQHRKCKDNHSFSFAKHRTLADFDSGKFAYKIHFVKKFKHKHMPLPCRPADFHKRKHDGLQLLARGSAAGLLQLGLLHSEIVLVSESRRTNSLNFRNERKVLHLHDKGLSAPKIGLKVKNLEGGRPSRQLVNTTKRSFKANTTTWSNLHISSIARAKRKGNQPQHRKCKENHPFSSAKHRTPADFDSAPPR